MVWEQQAAEASAASEQVLPGWGTLPLIGRIGPGGQGATGKALGSAGKLGQGRGEANRKGGSPGKDRHGNTRGYGCRTGRLPFPRGESHAAVVGEPGRQTPGSAGWLGAGSGEGGRQVRRLPQDEGIVAEDTIDPNRRKTGKLPLQFTPEPLPDRWPG
jgi:hypothetical protein